MAGARNFLFALDSGDVALTRLLSTARRVTGFMEGMPGGPLPGWYVPGGENAQVLKAIHDQVKATYPQAGRAYHAVRLWTGLIWQPAYLAVIAAHVHGAMPDLWQMSQQRRGMDLSGFRLPPGPQQQGDVDTLIARAGADLRAMAESMLAEVNGITKLKRVPALHLLADRMLALMVRLRDYVPGLPIDAQKRCSDLWLEAMGLTGQGDLELVRLDDGREVWITARKGCCLDYLAMPDTRCASCPRQDDGERVGRQRAEAMAELGLV